MFFIAATFLWCMFLFTGASLPPSTTAYNTDMWLLACFQDAIKTEPTLLHGAASGQKLHRAPLI